MIVEYKGIFSIRGIDIRRDRKRERQSERERERQSERERKD